MFVIVFVYSTERKKLYDDDIKMCNVLLKYLAKHESQAVPLESNSDVKERETATNELKSNENGKDLEFGLINGSLNFGCYFIHC